MGNEPTLTLKDNWLNYYGTPGCSITDKESKNTLKKWEGHLCPIINLIEIKITPQYITLTSKIYHYQIPHTPKIFQEWQEIAIKQWGKPHE